MKQIRSLVLDVKEEKIFSFIRDEDGFFRKVEKTVYRNRDTNEVKQGEEVVLDGLYRQTLDEEHDEEIKYQGIDGTDQILKLKMVDQES
tara:strand:- start:1255 stop:1521 length:267 start_codon:yes stop_codon:yes gene_type:complete